MQKEWPSECEYNSKCISDRLYLNPCNRNPTVDIISIVPSIQAEVHGLEFEQTRGGEFFAQCLSHLGQRKLSDYVFYDLLPSTSAILDKEIPRLLQKMSTSFVDAILDVRKGCFRAIKTSCNTVDIPEKFVDAIGKVLKVTLPNAKVCEVVPLPHPGCIPYTSRLSIKECFVACVACALYEEKCWIEGISVEEINRRLTASDLGKSRDVKGMLLPFLNTRC